MSVHQAINLGQHRRRGISQPGAVQSSKITLPTPLKLINQHISHLIKWLATRNVKNTICDFRVLEVLVGVYVKFKVRQASFPPVSSFLVTQANLLLALASYLTHRHETDIDPFLLLSARKHISAYKCRTIGFRAFEHIPTLSHSENKQQNCEKALKKTQII